MSKVFVIDRRAPDDASSILRGGKAQVLDHSSGAAHVVETASQETAAGQTVSCFSSAWA
jgi:hypothetical protein